MNEPSDEKRPSILPLHPAVVERMFYRPEAWEEVYRTDEPLRGGRPPQPDIGISSARFLRFLAPLLHARNALDLGTSLGYSAHVLASIVGPEGSVLSVEREGALVRRARENLKQSGLDKRVAVIMGEAGEVMRELTGPYDLVLLDVDKAQYLDLLPRIVELLAVDGHLVVDDVGFLSRDFEPRLRPLSLHMARFVKGLLGRKDMETVYIPLGDGFLLSRKVARVDEQQLSMFRQQTESDGAPQHETPAANGEPHREATGSGQEGSVVKPRNLAHFSKPD